MVELILSYRQTGERQSKGHIGYIADYDGACCTGQESTCGAAGQTAALLGWAEDDLAFVRTSNEVLWITGPTFIVAKKP